jgi:ATP-dependent RNA helicase RhlE
VTVPDFDYAARPQGKLEIPLAQRIAEIRARKREERARAAANAARRAAHQRGQTVPASPRAGSGQGGNRPPGGRPHGAGRPFGRGPGGPSRPGRGRPTRRGGH